jgi:hypothetical protein
MIESELGRTHGPEIGRRGSKARSLPETEDGDVRKPLATLALVDGEALEALPDGFCQLCAAPVLVVEDDHADAPCLPVAARFEQEGTGTGRRLAQRCCDRLDVGCRTAPEEGEGDVEVLPGNEAYTRALGQLLVLPRHEPAERLVRQAQSDEEA